MLILTIVIALLGVINTLTLSIAERAREIGLLRAIGMQRSQLRQLVAAESMIISVIGALLATIEVAGLRKRFGTTVALHGMSFTVGPGRVTGFVGPNGAGNPAQCGWFSAWMPPMRAARWSAGGPTGACGTR